MACAYSEDSSPCDKPSVERNVEPFATRITPFGNSEQTAQMRSLQSSIGVHAQLVSFAEYRLK